MVDGVHLGAYVAHDYSPLMPYAQAERRSKLHSRSITSLFERRIVMFEFARNEAVKHVLSSRTW